MGDATGIVGAPEPTFAPDGPDAVSQAVASGMSHDGIELFALPREKGRGERLLLAVNHEFVEPALLHADGATPFSVRHLEVALLVHGVSIIEIERARHGGWSVVRPSRHARRVTGLTAMRMSGPAAGSPHLVTSADPSGSEVLGTLGNCGTGKTPWGAGEPPPPLSSAVTPRAAWSSRERRRAAWRPRWPAGSEAYLPGLEMFIGLRWGGSRREPDPDGRH